jgi:hypothetical protein
LGVESKLEEEIAQYMVVDRVVECCEVEGRNVRVSGTDRAHDGSRVQAILTLPLLIKEDRRLSGRNIPKNGLVVVAAYFRNKAVSY